MVNTISVTLPNGNILDIEYAEALVTQVKQRYNLPDESHVSSELIKAFVEDELRVALRKHDSRA